MERRTTNCCTRGDLPNKRNGPEPDGASSQSFALSLDFPGVMLAPMFSVVAKFSWRSLVLRQFPNRTGEETSSPRGWTPRLHCAKTRRIPKRVVSLKR